MMCKWKGWLWALAAFAVLVLASAVVCAAQQLPVPAAVLVAAAGAGGFAFVRLWRQYRAARLIEENEIIAISPAQIMDPHDGREHTPGKVVISPFGILIGSRPYRFNCGSVKLISVEFTREAVLLCFGAEEKTYDLRLLHGLTERPEVENIAKKIQYETGVIAVIAEW